MLNNGTYMGRLTRDPELRITTGGDKVCSFTLAVERDRTKEATDFIDFVAWGGTAEFVCKYFRKGRMMAVEGPLQQRKWTDKNGNSRNNHEVNARSVYFCDDKPKDSGPDVTAREFAEYNGNEQLPF